MILRVKRHQCVVMATASPTRSSSLQCAGLGCLPAAGSVFVGRNEPVYSIVIGIISKTVTDGRVCAGGSLTLRGARSPYLVWVLDKHTDAVLSSLSLSLSLSLTSKVSRGVKARPPALGPPTAVLVCGSSCLFFCSLSLCMESISHSSLFRIPLFHFRV